MNRGVTDNKSTYISTIFILIIILSLSIVSASIVGDFWKKITGKATQDPLDCPKPESREFIDNGFVLDYGDGGQSLIVEFQGIGDDNFEQVYNSQEEFILIFDSVYNECDEFVVENYIKTALQQEIYLASKPNLNTLAGTPSFAVYKRVEEGGGLLPFCGDGICQDEIEESYKSCPEDCEEPIFVECVSDSDCPGDKSQFFCPQDLSQSCQTTTSSACINNECIATPSAQVCNECAFGCVEETGQCVVCTDTDSDGFNIEGGSCGQIDCNDFNSNLWQLFDGYVDNDRDSYGSDLEGLQQVCSGSVLPVGYVSQGGDCNDADSNIYPGASEVCGDGIDQDCNGFELIDTDGGSCLPGQVCDEQYDIKGSLAEGENIFYTDFCELNGQEVLECKGSNCKEREYTCDTINLGYPPRRINADEGCYDGAQIICSEIFTPSAGSFLNKGEDLFDEETIATTLTKTNNNLPDEIIRKRETKINIDSVPRQNGQEVILNLFLDATYLGKTNQIIKRYEESFTVFGDIEGKSGGSFAIAYQDGAIAGTVRTTGKNGKLFQISGSQDGDYLIKEIDETKLIEHDDVDYKSILEETLSQQTNNINSDSTSPQTDDGSTIDVMVVYTPSARIAQGGGSQMLALIFLAIDETNRAYLNSGIEPRLRLVRYGEVLDYDDSGDMNADLIRLRSTTDEIMNEVHVWRDESGADMVSLIVGTGQYCGSAYVMTSLGFDFAPFAFSVVQDGCATGGYSFGHELGHNLGSVHDHQNSGLESGLFSYSFGHRFTGTDGILYRTIMAYTPGQRVQHFSNPNVLYQGTPTGIPEGQEGEADNARSINEVKLVAANWRESVVNPPPPEPPIANTGMAHSDLLLNDLHVHQGASATDADSDLSSYSWEFVDCPNGLTSCPILFCNNGNLLGGSSDVNGPVYAPQEQGSYNVKLTVQDLRGNTDEEIMSETTQSSASIIIVLFCSFLHPFNSEARTNCVEGVLKFEVIEQSVCGNGVVENSEQCDGSDLSSQSCQSFGYISGDLSCNVGCTFNLNNCEGNVDNIERTGYGKLIVQVFDEQGQALSEDENEVYIEGIDNDFSGYEAVIDGEAVFERLPVGTYSVKVSSSGYWSEQRDRVMINSDLTIRISFFLDKKQPIIGQPKLVAEQGRHNGIFPNQITRIEQGEEVVFYLFGENFRENMPVYVDSKHINNIADIDVVNEELAIVTFTANSDFFQLFPGSRFAFLQDGYYVKGKGSSEYDTKVYDYDGYNGEHVFSLDGNKEIATTSVVNAPDNQQSNDIGEVRDDAGCTGFEDSVPSNDDVIECGGETRASQLEFFQEYSYSWIDSETSETRCEVIGTEIRTFNYGCIEEFGVKTEDGEWPSHYFYLDTSTITKNLEWYDRARSLNCAFIDPETYGRSGPMCNSIRDFVSGFSKEFIGYSKDENHDYSTCENTGEQLRAAYESSNIAYESGTEKTYIVDFDGVILLTEFNYDETEFFAQTYEDPGGFYCYQNEGRYIYISNALGFSNIHNYFRELESCECPNPDIGCTPFRDSSLFKSEVTRSLDGDDENEEDDEERCLYDVDYSYENSICGSTRTANPSGDPNCRAPLAQRVVLL